MRVKEHRLKSVPRAQAPLALCFFPSIISSKCAAAASISLCLYWLARLSAEITSIRRSRTGSDRFDFM
jgi:hypothetical protein